MNHFVIILDIVIPHISHPTPKMANPKEAIAADIGSEKLTKSRVNLLSPKSVVTPKYLMITPTTIKPLAITPVKRMPILSRIIPPKKSISINTLISP